MTDIQAFSPILGFIQQHVTTLLARLKAGENDYAQDILYLDHCLAIAQQQGFLDLQLYLISSKAALNVAIGRFDIALATIDHGIHLCELNTPDTVSLNHPSYSLWISRAELTDCFGDASGALDILDYKFGAYRQRPLEDAPAAIGPNLLETVYANMAQYHFSLGAIDPAYQLAQMILDWDDGSESVMTAYQIIAEYHLHKNNTSAATRAVQLLREIAASYGQAPTIFSTYCTFAHIAEHTGDYLLAEHYYETAITQLSIAKLPGYQLLGILGEARYHARRDNTAQRRRFAEIAVGLTQQFDIRTFDDEITRLLSD